MANGTTLFSHKCDSYFCVLPNANNPIKDAFVNKLGVFMFIILFFYFTAFFTDIV